MKQNQNINQEEDRLFLARKNNLEKIIQMGVDPYPKSFERSHLSTQVKDDLEKFEKNKINESLLENSVIAGRITAIRGQGKMIFIDLKDYAGTIQVAAKEDVLKDLFQLIKLLDIGDIAGFEGKIFRTRRGEPSLEAEKVTILTKSMRPLPDKWSGLKDVEKRYRQRYLDLISSQDSFETAINRTKIVSFIRNFMNEKGYVEVETPILVDIPAGANARPFSTRHNSLGQDLYLRIATELNLKKLIVGGIEKVYELGRVFRNEGIDHNHNPEFTTIESYEAYLDALMSVFSASRKFLKPNGYLVVVLQNIRVKKGHMVPLAWDFAIKLSKKYELKQERIWLQDNKRLNCWGYPSAYVSNVHHHYCLIFKKV